MRISIVSDGKQVASDFNRFKFVECPWYCSEWISENNWRQGEHVRTCMHTVKNMTFFFRRVRKISKSDY